MSRASSRWTCCSSLLDLDLSWRKDGGGEWLSELAEGFGVRGAMKSRQCAAKGTGDSKQVIVEGVEHF